MLKPSYATLDEVPAALRDHYALQDGRYVIQGEGFAEYFNSGLAANRDELRREKDQALASVRRLTADVDRLNGDVGRLTTELSTAKAMSLPAGHVAMPAADQQMLETYKSIGDPKDVKAKVDEHGQLKANEAARQRRDTWAEAAEAEGYDPEVLTRLNGLPEEATVRDMLENGKPVYGTDGKPKRKAYVKVKEGDTLVEKPLVDYIEQTADFRVFLPALKSQQGPNGQQQQGQQPPQGTQFPRQGVGTKQQPGSVVDEVINNVNKAHDERPNPLRQTTKAA